jgi:hypothetical protein
MYHVVGSMKLLTYANERYISRFMHYQEIITALSREIIITELDKAFFVLQ